MAAVLMGGEGGRDVYEGMLRNGCFFLHLVFFSPVIWEIGTIAWQYFFADHVSLSEQYSSSQDVGRAFSAMNWRKLTFF